MDEFTVEVKLTDSGAYYKVNITDLLRVSKKIRQKISTPSFFNREFEVIFHDKSGGLKKIYSKFIFLVITLTL